MNFIWESEFILNLTEYRNFAFIRTVFTGIWQRVLGDKIRFSLMFIKLPNKKNMKISDHSL